MWFISAESKLFAYSFGVRYPRELWIRSSLYSLLQPSSNISAYAELEDEPEELMRIDKEIKNDWREVCLTLLGFKDRDTSQNIITPSNEAFTLLMQFSNQAKRAGRTTGVLSDLPQFPSRYGENARKIAIILHASEHLEDCFKHQISKETAQKAIDLMQWFIWEQLAWLRKFFSVKVS